jgi:hypothetical protein
VMEKGHPHGDAHKVILCYNYFPWFWSIDGHVFIERSMVLGLPLGLFFQYNICWRS